METSVRKIERLLETGTALLGLKLCFRENGVCPTLPMEWRLHVAPPCLEHKDKEQEVCVRAAGIETDRGLIGQTEGRIQECPFGFAEIVAPVVAEGRYAGPVFAGPCWLRRGPPPRADLFVPPSRTWVEARVPLVRAIATEIGRLLESPEISRPRKRRATVLDYVSTCVGEASTQELAARLHLSPSRTTHLVRDLFGTSLPLLARRLRLAAAAGDLLASDLPIGEIGGRHGFDDPNYFSRAFRQEFGMPPRAYRTNYTAEA